MPVVGFLRSWRPPRLRNLAAAFRQGLNEAGYVEGQNVAIEYRYADNRNDQLPALIADLMLSHEPAGCRGSRGLLARSAGRGAGHRPATHYRERQQAA